MKKFDFSLAENIYLRKDPDGYFLVSKIPLRILRLNEPLFRLLEYLREGELSEFIRRNPGIDEGQLLRNLLSLMSRGYLKLRGVAEPEEYPGVSIVIPVRDQAEDLIECLKSLEHLNYPRDRLETIVVDDGSQVDITQIISSPDVRAIRLAESQGASVCRNIGAEKARGDILAFLDADCMAGENWLREIIPFFKAAAAGAVGGYVDGYYKDSRLDRYEEVASSLNMGRRLLLEGKTESSLYVPTANMLVTREAFMKTGGFKRGLNVGEDVDFCWRLRNHGYTLLYVPFGRVSHKHRGHLGKMLARRGDYGTSEAVLYRTHREKRKAFLISVYAGLSFLSLSLAVLIMNPYPLGAVLLLFGLDPLLKSGTLKKHKIKLPFRQLVSATLRSYLSFYYFAFFHLMRYYLLVIFGLGFWRHSVWLFGGLAILLTSIVDYRVKRPNLSYPPFLFFYLLEHLAYQLGVFWGCVKSKYFGSYLVTFRRA